MRNGSKNIYHAYRTTKNRAFELIGAFPEASSEEQVWKILYQKKLVNRRSYIRIDYFDPAGPYKGPDSYEPDEGLAAMLFP